MERGNGKERKREDRREEGKEKRQSTHVARQTKYILMGTEYK